MNINQLFETLENKIENVLAPIRLGHTGVTHSYLLLGEEQPQCVGCDAPFTVRHFLLECGDIVLHHFLLLLDVSFLIENVVKNRKKLYKVYDIDKASAATLSIDSDEMTPFTHLLL